MNEPSSRQPDWRLTNQTSSVLRLRRILVPIDFGERTAEALRYAAAYAREYKAVVTLLHVVKPGDWKARRGVSHLAEDPTEIGERQLRKLVDVIWGDEIATDIIVATGKAHEQIVNEAKETKADMIIIASYGPVGAWGLIRRGTATWVVRHAPCPVLVVGPFERGFAADGAAERCMDR
jgi:nucleotide-binding universal stress UspA family protein